MAFRISPGVSVKEIDLTTIVPAVATTPGGFAGYFHWGPVGEVLTIANERDLVNNFQKPENDNYLDFFTAANFLQYGNNCQVVRVVGSAARNSGVRANGGMSGSVIINNTTDFYTNAGACGSTQQVQGGLLFASKYPGVYGNSLKVVISNGSGVTGGNGLTLANGATIGDSFVDISLGSTSRALYMAQNDDLIFGDGTTVTVSGVQIGTPTPGSTFYGLTAYFGDFYGFTSGITAHATNTAYVARIQLASLLPKSQALGNTLSIKSGYQKYLSNIATTTTYAESVGGTGDLINVLVLDKDGRWTGTQNGLLEKFEGLSRAYDARKFDGSSNYYRTVINDQSKYIWAIQQDVDTNLSRPSTTAYTVAQSIGPSIGGVSGPVGSIVGHSVLSLGLTGAASAIPNDSERWANGWLQFQDGDKVDVSLLPLGNASATLAQLVVQQICEKRLDCIAFVSPSQSSVEYKVPTEALNNIKNYRDTTLNLNSSYAVLDSGWKYQLDTYNNLVRLVPLNPDIAGLVARTEFTNEAWFSPAGFNRGQVKSVVRLAYNPTSEAHRDELYARQVNPVVSFPGQGVILYGDKTMQTKPSAFDRINVRRLFIILEKAIATASKFFLFEQNDAFTRAQFMNLVVPFLKTIQQRRGITDFKVVCDDTNNTGEIIDRNEFVADIFVKPTRSINYIQLNFVATKTGVSFSEVANTSGY